MRDLLVEKNSKQKTFFTEAFCRERAGNRVKSAICLRQDPGSILQMQRPSNAA